MTIRDRLARAFIAELDRQGCYNGAPEPDEPLTSDTFRDFGGFIIDGSLDGWALLDAILAELSTPDDDMIDAASRRTQGPDDSLYGTIFTAMISSLGSRK